MPPKPAVSDGGLCSACAAARVQDLLHLSMHFPFPLALHCFVLVGMGDSSRKGRGSGTTVEGTVSPQAGRLASQQGSGEIALLGWARWAQGACAKASPLEVTFPEEWLEGHGGSGQG